ncbi:unnamed protein product [Prorocentrum cordatum]|uniref:C3H1-type domain-containing protein n=1 Tax=Prorocentrum cordatum TaxID=2364126 RepID=A0ABN9V456_9DINO|nr:unnamed protein product [Polarella glacialis]
MCPRCRNDTCLQCYPKEPTAEQPAPAAARPGSGTGARSESGGEDGEDEDQEVAEEVLMKASKGSAQHFAGICRPCLYMNTQVGCRNGVDCNFCHVPHKRKRRARPSKATRMQCKQLVAMLDSAYGDDDSQVVQAAETLAADSAYMRSILAAKGRQHPGQAEDPSALGWLAGRAERYGAQALGATVVARAAAPSCGACSPHLACPAPPTLSCPACVCAGAGGHVVEPSCLGLVTAYSVAALTIGLAFGAVGGAWAARRLLGQSARQPPAVVEFVGGIDIAALAAQQVRDARARAPALQ